MKKIIGVLINILIKASIGLVFVSFYFSIFEKELLKGWIEALRILILDLGFWNYPIAFISSLIESFPVLGIALPSQNILMAIAGFFGQQSTTQLIYIIILACAGAIIGNFIGYFLGKKYGMSFIDKYGMWVGIGHTEVKYLKKSMGKWGPVGIILGKFHPTTRTFLPFVAGISGMTSMKFALYNIIGSIIWSVAIVVLGVYFAEHYEMIIDYAGTIMTGIMVLAGLYIWKFKKAEFKQFMIEKNDEMDKKYGKKK